MMELKTENMTELQRRIEIMSHKYLNEIEQDEIEEIPSLEAVCGDKMASGKRKADIRKMKDSFINYYHPLNSYNNRLSAIVIFIKRLIRKVNKFLLSPILDEINAQFGRAIIILSEMDNVIDNLERRNQILEERIKKLETIDKEENR